MTKKIVISLSIDEEDMKALANEYESNDGKSFMYGIAERILMKVAEATREMRAAAETINMVNPLGNIVY